MLSRNRSIGLMLALAVTGMGLTAPAAAINWTKDGLGMWTNTAHWSSGTVPTSGDEAVFNKTLTVDRGILVDSNRGIGTITFNNSSAYKYDLNGGSLQLDNGGLIRTAATNGNHTDTITSATIAIQGDGGSATFTAGATSASSIMSISSAIAGVSTGTNITTLTLNGTNTGLNALAGIIGNGAGGGKLALVKSGTGTWSLNNAGNTFSGGVTLNSGTLAVSAAGQLGTGKLTLAGGTFALPSLSTSVIWTNDLDITGATTIGTIGLNATANFAGTNLMIHNNPTITVGGSTTTRGVNFTTNPMQLFSDAAITGSANNPMVAFAGGFDLKNGNRVLTYNNTTTNTIGGTISDSLGTSHTLTLAGSGAVTINTLGAFNNGSGLVLDGIIAKPSSATVFPGFITINSGSLDIQTAGLTLAGLNGAGGSVINAGGIDRVLTLDGSATYTYSGNIAPAVSTRIALMKTGRGTQILSGTNTYTGATTVKNGTLIVNGSLASAVTVENGASLGGTGILSGGVTINTGGTASPGNSPAIQNVGDFTLNTGAIYEWEYQGDAVGQKYDQYKLAIGKTLHLAGKWTLNLFNLGGTPVADLDTRYYIFDTTGASLTGLGVLAGQDVLLSLGTDYMVNYGISGYGNVLVHADADGSGTDGIYIIHVPEPTSLSLLGLGVAGLLLRRRRWV